MNTVLLIFLWLLVGILFAIWWGRFKENTSVRRQNASDREIESRIAREIDEGSARVRRR